MSKLVASFILIALFSQSCHKTCIPGNYTLYGGTTIIYPSGDSIHVGDTLWIHSYVPVNLKYWNYSTGDSMILNMSGATNLITDIHFIAFPKIDTFTQALDSFKLISLIGNIKVNPLAPHAAGTLVFEESQENFENSLYIVALKKGVYCITILDIEFAHKNCLTANITIPITSSTNQHLYFLDSVYFPGSRYEPSIPPIELTHDYCFKVY
jgi:hypothetical protein